MRSDLPLVSIHAGAHLTQTGDFRRFADVNRTRLETLGVAVACPSTARPVVWPDAKADVTALPQYADAIVRTIAPNLAQASRALVISDADLLGPEADLLAGKFYEGVGLRATALRMALGRSVDRVVLTIKPYDALFRSVWRKAAAEREVKPFAAHTRAMASFNSGWIEVVEALQDVLEPETLIVRSDMTGPEQLFQMLVPGCDTADMAAVDAEPEVTASAAATMQRHYRLGVPLAPGQRERMIAFHARQPQDPGAEAGFDPLALADMRGRYVADLSILAQMRGVDLRGNDVPMVPRRYARAGA